MVAVERSDELGWVDAEWSRQEWGCVNQMSPLLPTATVEFTVWPSHRPNARSALFRRAFGIVTGIEKPCF